MNKVFIFILFFLVSCNSTSEEKEVSKKKTPYSFRFEQEKLQAFFNQNKAYNTDISMFVDFGRASNKERFFVYNHVENKVILSSLVTHGSCDGETAPLNAKYSNQLNSYCSSLGKYKIGKPYIGKFGLAYKLHGLEGSNNKAYDRFIVLHSHSCVPNGERSSPICVSQGCPTVSPNFLNQISPIIDSSEKPILLWLYDSTQ